MRLTLGRLAAVIVVGLLVAACGSPPTPPPVTTPPQVTTAAPTSSPPATTPPPTVPPTPSPPPVATELPTAVSTVMAIASGYHHTCVLTSGGTVKCWGSNDFGQLGDGSTTLRTLPVDASAFGGGIRAVTAGDSHTCVLKGAGGVQCLGANNAGQLGNDSTTDSRAPVDVAGLGSGVRAIAAGGFHTCALTDAGDVSCWGSNEYGQVGTETSTNSSLPVAVAGLSRVTAIAAGDLHTCALTVEGGVTCWGYRGSGGSGSAVPVDRPDLASGVVAISAGHEESCALTTADAVKCWGGFDGGPAVEVPGLEPGIAAISGRFGQTCALATSGSVRCWGKFREDGPSEIVGLAGGVTSISMGGQHACALMRGGAVRCWGDNWQGQLGNGRPCSSWSGSTVPVEVDFAAATAVVASGTPMGRIEHATAPTDVVFRFNREPDVEIGELSGEQFLPGPEFTLYGDGTVIYRNEAFDVFPAEGPIVRLSSFRIAHLDAAQVQSFLQFALSEGGLGTACDHYPARETDVTSWAVYVIRAGGVDKRIESLGGAPFGPLHERLGTMTGDPSSEEWAPARYWGNLFEAASIEAGVLPDPSVTGTFPWPWPDIEPREFGELVADGGIGRRVMSADEASVLGLSDDGGVVKRVYLVGPDGETIYSFSLWPMLPDEMAPSTVPGTLPVRGSARELGERVRMAPGPGGTLFASIPSPNGSVLLTLLDSTGRPRPGWPIKLADAADCGLLLAVADGSVRVVCQLANQELNSRVRAQAFDSDGVSLPGWPVEFEGNTNAGRMVGDELTMVVTKFGPDVGDFHEVEVVAIALDGSIRRSVRGLTFETCCERWAVASDGIAYGVVDLHEWLDPGSPEASRIMALDLSGERRGFPVMVDGIASGPAFAPDGRIVVTAGSFTRSTSQAVAFDRDGRATSGGSAELPIVTAQRSSEHVEYPMPPVVAGDGTAFVLGDFEGGTTVFALDPSGQVVSGWPYRAADRLIRPCPPEGNSEFGCLSLPATPSVGPDNVLYLLQAASGSTLGGSLVAVEPDGRVRAGWPVELRRPGAEFWSVVVGSDGTVYALAVEPESDTSSSASILAIAPDSTVLWTTTILEP